MPYTDYSKKHPVSEDILVFKNGRPIRTERLKNGLHGTPLDFLKIFKNSYVQFDMSEADNAYIIKNNVPRFYSCNIGRDRENIPLFHEFAHFITAPLSKLHLDNYGYAFPYKSIKGWADLRSEIQVTSVERNLHVKYGIPHYHKKFEDDASTWDYLTGWNNYRDYLGISPDEMYVKMGIILKEYVERYPVEWAFEEWERRNTLLRERMRLHGTIVPVS